jgi:uncharacterized protein YoxC
MVAHRALGILGIASLNRVDDGLVLAVNGIDPFPGSRRDNRALKPADPQQRIKLVADDVDEPAVAAAAHDQHVQVVVDAAGKGFSVVASEVKALAQQTAAATDDVREQITRIRVATNSTVDEVAGITTAIAEIASNASEISESVTKQTSAVGEIAASISGLDTEADAAAAAELADCVRRTQVRVDYGRNRSQALSEQAEALRIEVHSFLRETLVDSPPAIESQQVCLDPQPSVFRGS